MELITTFLQSIEYDEPPLDWRVAETEYDPDNGAIEEKHLPGQHAQQSHGRKGTSRGIPVRVYHGTSSSVIDSILKEGILPGSLTGNRNWASEFYYDDRDNDVFVANSMDDALAFSRSAWEKSPRGSKVVVFEVEALEEFLAQDEEMEGSFRVDRGIPPEWIRGYAVFDSPSGVNVVKDVKIKALSRVVYFPVVVVGDEQKHLPFKHDQQSHAGDDAKQQDFTIEEGEGIVTEEDIFFWKESEAVLFDSAANKSNDEVKDFNVSLAFQMKAIESTTDPLYDEFDDSERMPFVMAVRDKERGLLQAVAVFKTPAEGDERLHMRWMASAPWNNHYAKKLGLTDIATGKYTHALGLAIAKKAVSWGAAIVFDVASQDVARLYLMIGARYENEFYNEEYAREGAKYARAASMYWPVDAMRKFIKRYDKSDVASVFDLPVIVVSKRELIASADSTTDVSLKHLSFRHDQQSHAGDDAVQQDFEINESSSALGIVGKDMGDGVVEVERIVDVKKFLKLDEDDEGMGQRGVVFDTKTGKVYVAETHDDVHVALSKIENIDSGIIEDRSVRLWIESEHPNSIVANTHEAAGYIGNRYNTDKGLKNIWTAYDALFRLGLPESTKTFIQYGGFDSTYHEGTLKSLIRKADPAADELLDTFLGQQDWYYLPDMLEQALAILKRAYEDSALKEIASLQEQTYALGLITTMGPARDFILTNPYVLKLLEEHAADMVRKVDQGTRFFLKQQLVKGVKEGYSPGEIIQNIQDNLFVLKPSEQAKLGESRIRSIVNTELNWAYSKASVDQATAVGLEMGRWVTRKYDVCDICLGNEAMNWQKVGAAVYNNVFGEQVAHPPGHPRTCHCYMEFDVSKIEGAPNYWTGGDDERLMQAMREEQESRGVDFDAWKAEAEAWAVAKGIDTSLRKHLPGRHDQKTHGRRRSDPGTNVRVRQEWQDAVDQIQNFTLESLAKREGVSAEDMKKKLDDRVAKLVSGSGVFVQVKQSSLASILERRELDNQFDTQTSSGLMNLDVRRDLEDRVFGIPRDASGADRPIYGYLANDPESAEISENMKQFGLVALEMRPDVRQRTTFMLGDSMDHNFGGLIPITAPQPLSAPSFSAWNVDAVRALLAVDKLDDVYAHKSMGFFDRPILYTEAQIHGDIKLQDIVAVRFTRSNFRLGLSASLKSLLRRLRSAGLKVVDKEGVEFVEKHLPGRHRQKTHGRGGLNRPGSDFDKSVLSADNPISTWESLTSEQQDKLADAPRVIHNRIAQELDDYGIASRDGDVNLVVAKRLDQVGEFVMPDTKALISTYAAQFAEYLESANVSTGLTKRIVLHAVDSLLVQEHEAMGRQLGDHGARHILGDINMAMTMLKEHPAFDDPREMAMLQMALIYHDTGYLTEPGSTTRMDKRHPKWSQQYFDEFRRDDAIEAFGEEGADRISEMIADHDGTTVDWENDPVHTAVRVADNLALFHSEKLPAIFKYVPENLSVLFSLGEKKITVEEARAQMLANVRAKDLPFEVTEALTRASYDINPMTPGFTLGMLGGSVRRLEWRPEGYMRVGVNRNAYAVKLQKTLDLGQRQFKKFAEAYLGKAGLDEKLRQDGFEFKNVDGKIVLDFEIYGEVIKHFSDIEKQPSEAQVEVGNYKKKHVKFAGMDVSVENEKGSMRSGGEGTNAWSVKMQNDYGYIRRTEGVDDDQVDVYVGPNEDAEYVYVIHQLRPDSGRYDEDKCMLGFDDHEAAKKAYLAHYDSPKFFGAMTAVPLSMFKEKVFDDKGEVIVPDAKKRAEGEKKSLYIEQHLPGRHAQKTHGHRGLGLQDEIDVKQREAVRHGEAVEDVSVRLKRSIMINGRKVNIVASVEGGQALQKIFKKNPNVTLDMLVEAYTGGLEDLPRGTTLNIDVDVSQLDKQIDIIGIIKLGGKKIGNFDRTISTTQSGKVIVAHSLFTIAPKYQGSRYGSKMFYASEEAYKRMGVDRIKVEANNTVGGYAWARMGFDFDGNGERDSVSDDVANYLEIILKADKIRGGEGFDDYAFEKKAIKMLKKLRYPFEFAAFTYKSPIDGTVYRVGKSAMLASTWSGVKYLQRKSYPPLRAGNVYKRLKLRKR